VEQRTTLVLPRKGYNTIEHVEWNMQEQKEENDWSVQTINRINKKLNLAS
jgi:hypothetical protein